MVYDGKRWWDYSDYWLNLNGRICAEGLILFGFGGMFVVYVAAPFLDNEMQKMNPVSDNTCGGSFGYLCRRFRLLCEVP